MPLAVGSLLCLLASWVSHCRLHLSIHPTHLHWVFYWLACTLHCAWLLANCLSRLLPCLQLLAMADCLCVLFVSPCYKLCVLYSVAGHCLCSCLVHFLGKYFKGHISNKLQQVVAIKENIVFESCQRDIFHSGFNKISVHAGFLGYIFIPD